MTKEEMFNQNINLAYKVANKYLANYKNEHEDIKQIALIGLWKAVLTYNDKYIFSTYAYTVISNEINYYLRKAKKDKILISISQEIGDNLTIEDTLKDEKDYISNIEEKQDLQRTLKNYSMILKKREQVVFIKMLQNKKQQKIANELRISQAQVSRIEKNIATKLKKRGLAYDV